MDDSPLAAWLREAPGDDTGWDGTAPEPVPGPAPEPVTRQATAAGDPLPWDDDSAPPPKRRRLLILAGIPWLALAAVAAALVVRGASQATPATRSAPPPAATLPAAAPEGPGAAGDAAEAATGGFGRQASATATPTPAPASGEAPGAAAGDAGLDAGGEAVERQALEAVATTAVRAGGTRLVAGDQRYVDAVAVERVRWTGTVAVVTVRAVVLTGRGDAWTTARPERLAVPVERTADGYVAVAPAWPLPVPTPAHSRWRPVRDPALAAAVAASLTEAGWSGLGLPRLERSVRVPGALRVRVRARPPGGGGVTTSEVWLTDESRPRVLGTAVRP